MNNQLSIKVDREMVSLQDDDILFIKSRRDYLMITTPARRYITHCTMKDMEAISSQSLTRVHRCYIVNLTKVKMIDENKLIVNQTIIPVSKHYRLVVMEKIAHLKTA